MTLLNRVNAIVFCLLIGGYALAEETPKLDPVKYPQDTPENALASVIKALEAEDYGYWLTWIVTPDSTARTLEKFKTLDAAIADSKTNAAKIAGRKALLESIKKGQKEKKTTEGTDKGVAWFRFLNPDGEFVQLEKQPAGRWCMNPRARTNAK
jgi:hypothetical protein